MANPIQGWSPSAALILSVSGGVLYAVNDIATDGGKKAVKILAASVAVGFIATAIDDATGSPVGTALAGLFLFAAFMTKGANAILVVSRLITGTPKPVTAKASGVARPA